MAPTLLAGDYILSSKLSFGFKIPWSGDTYFSSLPQPGELVVYQKNSKTYIKRVLASPNQHVELKSGDYHINSISCFYDYLDNQEADGYSFYNEKCGSVSNKILKLKEKVFHEATSQNKLTTTQFYVVGDYRNFEKDINTGEVIEIDQIIGKPLFIWMSYSSTQDFISKSLGIRWKRIMTML